MEDRTQRAITAYLINPSTLTIEPVQMQGGKDHLADLQALIDCRTITSTPMGERDLVYCDDEGLLGDPVFQFFGVKGMGKSSVPSHAVMWTASSKRRRCPTNCGSGSVGSSNRRRSSVAIRWP